MENYHCMDLHNHTNNSDGYHSAETIIQNAIENNLATVGISDHFDTIKCYKSVSARDLLSYIEKLQKLKDKYKDKIQVLAGIEICLRRKWSNLDKLPYETLNKLDYVLFEYVDLYLDSITLEELYKYTSKITCDKGLAHTDLFMLKDKYGLDFVIKTLQENDLFWELNANGGYEYFDEIIRDIDKDYVIELFNKLKEADIRITVGSDTHCLDFYNIKAIKQGNQLAQYNLDIIKYIG